MTTTWSIPRESREWVPVTVTITASGQPATGTVQFALLPYGQRPAPTDWTAPTLDPDGSGRTGLQVNPVPTRGLYGVWVRVTDTAETPVLDPTEVGWINRT